MCVCVCVCVCVFVCVCVYHTVSKLTVNGWEKMVVSGYRAKIKCVGRSVFVVFFLQEVPLVSFSQQPFYFFSIFFLLLGVKKERSFGSHRKNRASHVTRIFFLGGSFHPVLTVTHIFLCYAVSRNS